MFLSSERTVSRLISSQSSQLMQHQGSDRGDAEGEGYPEEYRAEQSRQGEIAGLHAAVVKVSFAEVEIIDRILAVIVILTEVGALRFTISQSAYLGFARIQAEGDLDSGVDPGHLRLVDAGEP